MQKLYKQGRIVQTSHGAVPRQKRYLDEMPGVPLQDLWLDIRPVQGQSIETVGYATQTAKARGKRLGNPKLSEARRHATAARKESADRFSTNVLPVIREIQRSGIKSLRGIARALAARGIPTARGGAWTPVQVSAILQRAS